MFLSGKRKRSPHPRQLDIDCSWCGSDVPLLPGEFSGVCIDCGTVMFRPALAVGLRVRDYDYSRNDIRGNGGSIMPSPA